MVAEKKISILKSYTEYDYHFSFKNVSSCKFKNKTPKKKKREMKKAVNGRSIVEFQLIKGKLLFLTKLSN